MRVCAVCSEESGGQGTSVYGSVHKYGPVTHHFEPYCPDCDAGDPCGIPISECECETRGNR